MIHRTTEVISNPEAIEALSHVVRRETQLGSVAHDTALLERRMEQNAAGKSTEFYAIGSEAEVKRLELMAEVADKVSLRHLDLIRQNFNGSPLRILDVGCGDSVSLGNSVNEKGDTYVATDMREDAVARQVSQGHESYQNLAIDLNSIKASEIDIVHSRFTWGWLSDCNRRKSMEEMLRVSNEDICGICVIDYDWSVVDGPDVFIKAIDNVKQIMRASGFEPDYGAQLSEDFSQKLDKFIDNSNRPQVITERYPVYEGTIGQAYAYIRQTADAILEQLNSVDMVDSIASLQSDLVDLEDYIKRHPEAHVNLPEIVACHAVIPQKQTLLSSSAKKTINKVEAKRLMNEYIGPVQYKPGLDYDEYVDGLETLGNVVIARPGSYLENDARRIQAAAYIADNIVGQAAIDSETGMLTTDVDPLSLVDKSTYLVALKDESTIAAVIRGIMPDCANSAQYLPTIQRMSGHSPKTLEALQGHPIFAEDTLVFEVSALAKNPLGYSLMDVSKTVLGLAHVARGRGYEYGVMGLQKSHVELIESIFGTKAVHRIQGEDAEHSIDLPGVRQYATFVPLIVHIPTFLGDVEDYIEAKKEKKNAFFAQLGDMTHDLILKQ